MLSGRENLLKMLRGEPGEYVPLTTTDIALVGMNTWELTDQPFGDGIDPFGVIWRFEGIGSMPDNTKGFMFDDITKWKDYVKFPDIDDIDFHKLHEEEKRTMPIPDYDKKIRQYYQLVGIFERLAAFMGFEEALCAMYEEPEAVHEFFQAFTEYKLKVAEKVIDAFHPDVLVYFDDVANARSTFMSPEMYRKMIMPYHKKVIDFVKSKNVHFCMHVCGNVMGIIDDYVEMGVEWWHSAQVMNDIPEIAEKYNGKLIIEGGWDSQGIPGSIEATEEEIREEVRRCVQEYGSNGNYILCPGLFNKKGNAKYVGDDRYPALIDEWEKCRSYV